MPVAMSGVPTSRERMYESLFEAMGVAAISQCRDGKIFSANKAAESILGRSAEEMMGITSENPDWGTVHPDGTPWPGSDHPAMVTLRTGVPQRDVLMGVRHSDGELRWIRVSSQPACFGEGGECQAVIATFHDVTDKILLQSRLQGQIAQLDRALSQTLAAMADMIELRDPYTAGHQRQVAAISFAIAKAMGLDDARCLLIQQAGLVHDIGKIAIPAEILVKPSRLTSLEYEVVKLHVDCGYRILKTIDFAQPIAEIVLQHHERLNGSGYPHGLVGQQVCLEARIIAVADVVDSMISHRPYRPALGVDATLAELEKNSGLLYDADVVAAFKQTLSNHGRHDQFGWAPQAGSVQPGARTHSFDLR